jgi:uncharacterized membrane protein HdeD (DUF308 family)
MRRRNCAAHRVTRKSCALAAGPTGLSAGIAFAMSGGAEATMLSILARTWWLVVLRGVAAVAIGGSLLAWPMLTMEALVALVGGYLFVDGVFALLLATRRRDDVPRTGLLLLEGVTGLAIGLAVLAWPAASASAFVVLLAAWAVVTGALELALAIRVRRDLEGELLYALSGAASILLGILVLSRPLAGLLAIAWLIAAYQIGFGALLIAFGMKLRRFAPGRRTSLAI